MANLRLNDISYTGRSGNTVVLNPPGTHTITLNTIDLSVKVFAIS